MDLLSFREEICNGLLMANKSMFFDQDRLNTRTSSRAASVPPSRTICSPLSAAVRLDKHARWPTLLDQKNTSC